MSGSLSVHNSKRISISEMIHHHGASLSKQQTADSLTCHGTQQGLVTVYCLHERNNPNSMTHDP